MCNQIINHLELIKNFLWSGPVLLGLLLVGGYQTINIQGMQFKHLWLCLKLSFLNNLDLKDLEVLKKFSGSLTSGSEGKGISAFQAMMTALAGSIGTGNIAGISSAVAIGGFGALFWMWVVAALGMATAYVETVLAVKYRQANASGEFAGGPMYYLGYRLKLPKVAVIYAIFGVIVSITLGCLVQANSVIDAITGYYPFDRSLLGLGLSLLTGLVIIGGVQSIGKVAGILVPFMTIAYLGTGLIIMIFNYQNIIPGLILIVKSAFVGQAPIGGFVGSTLWLAIQNGAQYGVFANEAGLGSLAIAAASAKTASPVMQGMRSIAGVFIATMIICTITGLMLVVTNVVGATDPNGLIKGARLVMLACNTVHVNLQIVVIFSLAMFAFTTIVAWAYYGEKSIEYLFGLNLVKYYRWIFTGCIFIGAILELDLVWTIANLSTALMTIPNLLGIMLLTKEVKILAT